MTEEEPTPEEFAALFDDSPSFTVGFLGARIDPDMLKLGHPAIVDARLEGDRTQHHRD